MDRSEVPGDDVSLPPGRGDPARLAELTMTTSRGSLRPSWPYRSRWSTLLDEERDWFKSCFGVQQTQSPAVTSFCEMFFTSHSNLIVVNDTLLDERLAHHALVIGRPFIRFYAAARLVVRGQTVGTLCAYDVEPREITPDQVQHLQHMAAAVVEFLRQRIEPH